LADALGVSAIHVNRMLQHLWREKVIFCSDGTLEIINRRRVAETLQRVVTHGWR